MTGEFCDVKHVEKRAKSSPANSPSGLWSEESVTWGSCTAGRASGGLGNLCSGLDLRMLMAVCLMEWLTMGFWMVTNADCWEMQEGKHGRTRLWLSSRSSCFCLPCPYIIQCLTSLVFPASVLSITTTGKTIIYTELGFCKESRVSVDNLTS